MDLFTYNPMETGVSIRAGVMRGTRPYSEILRALANLPGITVPSLGDMLDGERRQYDELAEDNFDLRLFVWHAAAHPVEIHVYPNGIAMAEVSIDDVPKMEAKALNAYAQERPVEIISECFEEFQTVLAQVRAAIPEHLSGMQGDTPMLTRPRIDRVSRTLLMTDAERCDPGNAELIRDWLSNTIRPEDAELFIGKQIDYSMTWVNYVVVKEAGHRGSAKTELEALLFPTMRIAQYFWSAQQTFNRRAQETITEAILDNQARRAEHNLERSRLRMRMLDIDRHELRGGLSRERSRLLEEILELWSFESAVRNGELLAETSSNRIAEIAQQRISYSSLITDGILALFTLISGLGLVLSLVQYSREVMSRPVLEYQDSDSSTLLSVLAGIDIDLALLSAFLFLICLFVVYLRFKLR